MLIPFLAILMLACAMALLAKRWKKPYTVLLVAAGLAVSLLLELKGTEALRGHLEKIKLEPDLLLQLFLPILLFEAAFHVNLQQFLRNWRPILFLAIPGVIVGMLLTTAIFWPVAHFIDSGMNWEIALLIAAMLAATDPISVVALFKDFSVSKRLGIIIEGESLINDGIAVVLFGVVIKITADSLGLTIPAIGDVSGKVEALHVLGEFVREVLLGAAIGLAIGLAISWLTSKVNDHLIEVALTVIAAYGATVGATEAHASGVIAVVVCGMMIGNVGAKHGMSPTTREAVFSFWEFTAFLANSFVFILIGLEINLRGLWSDAGLIGIFFVTMIVVRLVVVFGVNGLVRREDLRLKKSWLPVITWAGVRGSLSMVLAMMLMVTATGKSETRDTILNIVYGVVLLSILLQGTTIEWLMKRVGIIVETSEEIEYEMALARRQAIRALSDDLEKSEKKGNLSNVTFKILHDRLLARRTANDTRMAQMLEAMPSLNDIELGMEASQLCALEKQIYRDLEKEGDIDYESMESLVRDVVERGREGEEDSG
jgi:CPA1 family monovalent cation:H+ antiporter